MASAKTKAEKYLKAAIGLALTCVKHHYVVAPSGQKVFSSFPFEKAVNTQRFPEYSKIISNPIDLAMMERKAKSISSMGFMESLDIFLADMDLMRDNCYKFNEGPDGADIRCMVDMIRNYFRFLLRVTLRVVQQIGDEDVISLLIAERHKEFLNEPDALDVYTFLTISGTSVESLVHGAELPRILVGAKCNSVDIKARVQLACQHSNPPLQASLPPPPAPATSASGRAAATATLPASALTQVLPSIKFSKVIKKPKAAEIASPATPEPEPAKSGNKSKKRKAGGWGLESDAVDALFADEDDFPAHSSVSVDPFLSSPPSVPASLPPAKKSKKKSTSGVLSTASTSAAAVGATAHGSSAATAAAEDFEDYDEHGFPITTTDAASARPRVDWQVACELVYKTISKHPFVDPLRATAIANFFVSVVEANPSLAHEYLSIVSHPMDLTTLKYNLDNDVLRNAAEFYDNLILVFQNAVDFNSTLSSTYATRLANHCALLVKYARWLCLEHLPLPDEGPSGTASDVGKASSDSSAGSLSVAARDQARKQREELLHSTQIAWLEHNPYSECKKLLKDLERCRNNHERGLLSFFLLPVDVQMLPDYTVFVRFPADLGSIKYRLDGTLNTDSRFANAIDKSLPPYRTFGEFFVDLRRVFSNAIAYNNAHIEGDTTGLSKEVRDAAVMFSERLESLLPKATLGLSDRVERLALQERHRQEDAAAALAQQLAQERELAEISKRIYEDIKQSDPVLAAEFDVEKKRRETEMQLQEQLLAQRKALVLASRGPQHRLEDLANEDEDVIGGGVAGDASKAGPGQTSLMLSGAAMGTASWPSAVETDLAHSSMEIRREETAELFIVGYGVAGQVPKRFAHVVHTKHAFQRRAWSVWPDELHS